MKFSRSRSQVHVLFIMTSEPSEVNKHEGRLKHCVASPLWGVGVGGSVLFGPVQWNHKHRLWRRERGITFITVHMCFLQSGPLAVFRPPAICLNYSDSWESHKGFGGTINTARCCVLNTSGPVTRFCGEAQNASKSVNMAMVINRS